jgi:hypothetical protein
MNNNPSRENELKPEVSRVHGPNVIGSRHHDAAVMLSFLKPGGGIIDVFLDRQQAETVQAELACALSQPKE